MPTTHSVPPSLSTTTVVQRGWLGRNDRPQVIGCDSVCVHLSNLEGGRVARRTRMCLRLCSVKAVETASPVSCPRVVALPCARLPTSRTATHALCFTVRWPARELRGRGAQALFLRVLLSSSLQPRHRLRLRFLIPTSEVSHRGESGGERCGRGRLVMRVESIDECVRWSYCLAPGPSEHSRLIWIWEFVLRNRF